MPALSTQLESVLTRAWMRRGVLACVLWPLSRVFSLLARVRRGLYRSGRLPSTALPVPVIVVGNLFVGGTGKTPLTIWLVQALRAAGFVPGVISRGHGAEHQAPLEVRPDSAVADVGDEPLLIALRAQCPVMVGRNRVAAAQALLRSHPEINVLISDDGLQHYAMRRDIEIVLADARGAGNGWMLPAGPLREPLTRRRDFSVINAAHLPADAPAGALRMHLAGDYAERLGDRGQRQPLRTLAARQAAGVPLRIVAAAGIGNPQRFFQMLRAAGLVLEEMPLPDHYDFSGEPFAKTLADVILITEKDAVKCRQLERFNSDPRLWVVPVAAHIDGALDQQIVEKLRGRSTA